MKLYLLKLPPLLATIILYCCVGLSAQDIKERSYTLQSITVTADTSIVRDAGITKVDFPIMQHMVTALGEGDVIKYIQTIPGIAAGVEGTSSFYVRGGNLGNNVVTIDGVRLYGYGHLLGITSAFSNDIVGNANFNVGGFSAESYNLLASHINITTKEPNFKDSDIKLGVSNFMLSSYASSPIIKDKLAFEISARISPLSMEYKVGEEWLDKRMEVFNNLTAQVYDIFGKVSWKPHKKHTINTSFFYSTDNLSYGDINVNSYDKMYWENMISNLEWICNISKTWKSKANISYNNYKSGQALERILQNHHNYLAINSGIEELSINTSLSHIFSHKWSLLLGARATSSNFNPGSTKEYNGSTENTYENKTKNLLGNVYSELKFEIPDKYRLSLVLRGNYFIGKRGKQDEYRRFEPEISFSASKRITKWMGVEATFDRLAQYYHTLEGIPLGWSLDMIVPSSENLIPEKGTQYYGGIYFKPAKNHKFSIGAYYKEMDNLIYFEKANEFFGQTLSGWKNFIKTGNGKSKGIEFLYQKNGERLNYKIAYTFSKTTRFFPELNNGHIFRAKFDRPHILNVTTDYIFHSTDKKEYGVNLLFNFQSGNLESVKSGFYPNIVPGYDFVLDYYSGFNNIRLEDYLRIDLGTYAKWKNKKNTHNLQVGIYNVTNRHNIFSLYYDSDEKIWKKVYVFPIMPSISYKIEF